MLLIYFIIFAANFISKMSSYVLYDALGNSGDGLREHLEQAEAAWLPDDPGGAHRGAAGRPVRRPDRHPQARGELPPEAEPLRSAHAADRPLLRHLGRQTGPALRAAGGLPVGMGGHHTVVPGPLAAWLPAEGLLRDRERPLVPSIE